MRKRYILGAAIMGLLIFCSGCGRDSKKSNEEGIAYYEAENYTQALIRFNQAITQKGTVGEYYTNRGMTYLMMGAYDDAERDFQSSLQLDGDTMQVHRGMGILYMAREEYEAAIAEFDQAIALTGTAVGSQDFDILQHKADAQVLMKDYNGAVETYSTLIQLEVATSENYMRRGILYLKGGSAYLQYALEDFDFALEKEENVYEGYQDIYDILMDYGYETEAAAYVERALALDAVAPEDYFEKGKLYFSIKEYVLASHQFEIAAAQGISQAEYYLACCAEKQGDYQTAEEIYQRLMVDPAFQTAESYNQLGACMVQDGQYTEAEIHFQEALALDDGTMEPYILWNEAIMYEKQERFEEAYEVMLRYGDKYTLGARERKKLAYLRTRC